MISVTGKNGKNENKSDVVSNGHDDIKNAKTNGAVDSNANDLESVSGEDKKNDESVDKKKDAAKSEEGDGSEENYEEDIDLDALHDSGITVHIQSPGAELLSVQLSSMELVQEIHQLLMDREDTCHRTCFSLQLDGVTLDNFAELKTIEGLKHGSINS